MSPIAAIVANWIENVSEYLDEHGDLPLIDVGPPLDDPEDGDFWLTVFHSGFDDELRKYLESAIASNPDDRVIRCVALSAYWWLTSIPSFGKEDVEDMATHERFCRQLRHFVRERDLQTCIGIEDIRWETSNAGVVCDPERSFQLVERLRGQLAEHELRYIQGRLAFQFAFSKLWDVPQGTYDFTLGSNPSFWNLPWDHSPSSPKLISAFLARLKLSAAALDPALSSKEPGRFRVDSIHDAIKHLSGIACRDKWPEVDLMLGRCHFELQNYSAASETWFGSITSFGSSMEGFEALEHAIRDQTDTVNHRSKIVHLIKPMLYGFLAKAFERAGKPSDAIRTMEEWIEEFPEHPGTYERLARIHSANCEPVKAYECLRKETDRNPIIGEDPIHSLILQLGPLAADYLDVRRAIRLEAEKDPNGVALLRETLLLQWPAFSQLPDELQVEWSHGIWGRVRSPYPVPVRCRALVNCVTSVLEVQLKSLVFEEFRAEVPLSLESTVRDKDADLLRSYLRREEWLEFGKMLRIIARAQESDAPGELILLSGWLNDRYPHVSIEAWQSRKVTKIRNRAHHSHSEPITEEEATLVYSFCWDSLKALHQRERSKPIRINSGFN